MGISPGTLRLGVAAILIGLVGAYGVQKLLNDQEPPPNGAPQPQTTLVPLASADLPVGRVVALGDIALMPMTRTQMEERNLPLDRLMIASEQVIGRRLRRSVSQGNPFLTTDMFLQGQGPDLSDLLQPGYRAVNVLVADVRGGTVKDGDTVDVLFRSEPRPETDTEVGIPEATITLMEGVQVLQVARPQLTELQAVVGYVAKDPMVTLAVTPDQAAALQVIQGRGEISLVQRAPNDLLVNVSPKRVTFEELLGLARKDPDNRFPFATEVYRSTSRSVNVFRNFMVVPSPADPPGRVETLVPVGATP